MCGGSLFPQSVLRAPPKVTPDLKFSHFGSGLLASITHGIATPASPIRTDRVSGSRASIPFARRSRASILLVRGAAGARMFLIRRSARQIIIVRALRNIIIVRAPRRRLFRHRFRPLWRMFSARPSHLNPKKRHITQVHKHVWCPKDHFFTTQKMHVAKPAFGGGFVRRPQAPMFKSNESKN